MDRSNDWLVVMTKPKMEADARDHLVRQGYEAYLPLWPELKQRRGAWVKVDSPMFPRYLFVRQTYPEQSILPIRSTRGISQLVRFGTDPALASEQLIDDLQRLEAERKSEEQQLFPFKKGQRVEVTAGPFQGVSAEVLSCGQQRVILLLQVLGKVQRLEFDTKLCRAN
ncbi:MAG: transcription termination/antitermination NusG family protein [Sedimenticola sp.]